MENSSLLLHDMSYESGKNNEVKGIRVKLGKKRLCPMCKIFCLRGPMIALKHGVTTGYFWTSLVQRILTEVFYANPVTRISFWTLNCSLFCAQDQPVLIWNHEMAGQSINIIIDVGPTSLWFTNRNRHGIRIRRRSFQVYENNFELSHENSCRLVG